MHNYSGIRLSGTATTFLTQLETDVGVPIRLIDAGGRAVTPDGDSHDYVLNNIGYETTVIDEDYGGFYWEPEQHPDGFDMSEGLTILFRATSTPMMRARSATDVIAMGNLNRGTAGRNMMERVSGVSDHFLWLNQGPDGAYPEVEDYLHRYEALPMPDWQGDQQAPPYVEAFTLGGGRDGEGGLRCLTYPFRANRMNTGNDLSAGRVPRDILWRLPIEMAISDSEQHRQRAMERAHEEFREFATGRLNTRIRDVRASVSTLENDLHIHQQALVDATARLRDEKVTLDTLIAMDRGEATGIDPDSEWEAIERHAMVERFTIRGGRFIITTAQLPLVDPDTGDEVTLGELEISFPLQPGSGRGINVRNLTNAMDDGSGTPRPHPHCPGGIPCFGNVMSEVARMSAAGEVGGLLELLLQYLTTFNPRDDYGRYAGLWFEGEVRPSRRD